MHTIFVFQDTSRYNNISAFCSLLYNNTVPTCEVVNTVYGHLQLVALQTNTHYTAGNASYATTLLYTRGFFRSIEEKVLYIYYIDPNSILDGTKAIAFTVNLLLMIISVLIVILFWIKSRYSK